MTAAKRTACGTCLKWTCGGNVVEKGQVRVCKSFGVLPKERELSEGRENYAGYEAYLETARFAKEDKFRRDFVFRVLGF